MPQVLLLEIGVEELPASFVASAVQALPGLVGAQLAQRRLEHGKVWATGTPRRLAVMVEAVADAQPDLDEEVTGPPTRVAFAGDGQPTKAALSFAAKVGCEVGELVRRETPKGEYLVGRRREQGRAAASLLPEALAAVCGAVPFRKSMRWADLETAFGRPVQWVVALLGEAVVPFDFAGVSSDRFSRGHRFLAPDAFSLNHPSEYVQALRERHVLVDVEERRRSMTERLHATAVEIDGQLIEDDFLVEENSSLVEDPQVVAGAFDDAFLKLPESVILAVAKGHQRYFGVRDARGRLLPRYLAVVGTSLEPANIRRGNDRVMRARLADAMFFYEEDLKRPLASHREALDAIVFHKRLGSIGDKVRRAQQLAQTLGEQLALPATTIERASEGLGVAKCDLVSLMVGELPELQGEMGKAYAMAQGVSAEVAEVISEHYLPRGADDPTAPHDPGALAALADRLDTLTGCFAVGLMPTGTADPLALRRAGIGMLRTVIDRGWPMSIDAAVALAWQAYSGVSLDLGAEETTVKLGEFLRLRLRGVLDAPSDVVDACMAAGADRPHDVARRARALVALDVETRANVGEVFKRAANIAKGAPKGPAVSPARLDPKAHPSEQAVFDAFVELMAELTKARASGDYTAALSAIADFAPTLGRFFEDVFVMVDDDKIRSNRLRLMRDIHSSCSGLADFNLLAAKKGV